MPTGHPWPKAERRHNWLAYRRRWSKTKAGIKSRKNWRKNNTEKWAILHRRSVKVYYKRKKAWVASYKLMRGCKLCGFRKWPEALDFDHKDPKQKRFNISGAMKNTLDVIKAEVAKCNVICANCHRHKSWLEQKRRMRAGTLHERIRSR